MIRFKKKKIAKLWKSKNAHRKNFEKINVKNKSLLMNKQIIKKVIKNLKRRLRDAKTYAFSINSNRENFKSRFSLNNKKTKKQSYKKILRQKQLLSNIKFESNTKRKTKRYIKKMFVSKHKYSKLLLFYNDATKWKT